MRRVLSIILMALFLTSILACTPVVLGSKLSVVAAADSYTERNDPDVNHGGASLLYSYYCEYELFDEIVSYEEHTWLKFDLSKIPSEATVNSIILRVHTSFATSTTNKVGVFLCSNTDWEEMEITWNNCPEITGPPVDTMYVGSSDTDYDFDVTSAVEGKSVVTLVLKTLEPTELLGWAGFFSKEYTFSTYHPRLVIEYMTPSTPLDFTFLIVIAVVVVAVIMLVGYAIMKKKKQSSLPSVSSVNTTLPSSTLFFY